MIKNILFDLDDTILDFKKAERVALTKTLKTMGIPVNENILTRYSEINISQWKRLELGEISRGEVKVNRYRLLFEEFGINASPNKATEIYEDNLCFGHFFIDYAEELLDKLYGKYNLYLVSNGAKRVQDGRLKSAGISHYFENIFISEVVGTEKPNKAFFDFCFSKIKDFNPSETIIVGDSLSSDIKGGVQSGIKTVWFNPHNQENATDIVPDYEIKKLEQVFGVLTKL